MGTFVKGYWVVVFFVAVAIVRLRGDDLVNGTAVQAQGNTNSSSSSVHLKLPPSKDNVEEGNRSSTEVVLNNNKKRGPYNRGVGREGGGGGGDEGGGGGDGGGGGYEWGWGGGGGGGGWYKWGCGGRKAGKGNGRGRNEGSIGRSQAHRKRVFSNEDYKMGEFAQCTVRGTCRGMRLDCPLHCGGPCVYDSQHMCKAHCRRP